MIVVLSNCIFTRDIILPELTQLYKTSCSPKILKHVDVSFPSMSESVSILATLFAQTCVARFQELDFRTFSAYVYQTGTVFAELVCKFSRICSYFEAILFHK